VLGGESIYTNLLPKADLLRMTEIHKDYAGEVFFPEYRDSVVAQDNDGVDTNEGEKSDGSEVLWYVESREDLETLDKRNGNAVKISFIDYVRR